MERDSALLTARQREFLREGDSGMSDRGIRAARSRIRTRVRSGLRDFPVILEAVDLENEDTVLEFEDLIDEFESDELAEVLRSQVEFVYRACQIKELDFVTILLEGLQHAEDTHTAILKYRFDRRDPSLTMRDIEHLREKGEISKEELSEYREEMSKGILEAGPTLTKLAKRPEEVANVMDEVIDDITDESSNL